MRRIKEEFLDIICAAIKLKGRCVLEIGSGDGVHSVGLAQRCRELFGIDPDPHNVERAKSRCISNAFFHQGKAEALTGFPDKVFDSVFFTLSFHHVPAELMPVAIDEAVRVVKSHGHIVFLEPGDVGSYFDAEIRFDAGDGDEREAKRNAHRAMLAHPHLEIIREYPDETIVEFDSLSDFETAMTPKRNRGELESFLRERAYRLSAERRINLFRPKHR